MSNPLKYLIVDDEEMDRLTIETQASGFSFLHKIASCSHPLEAFELIKRFKQWCSIAASVSLRLRSLPLVAVFLPVTYPIHHPNESYSFL